MKLSVVIPAYNEENTLEAIVDKLFTVEFPEYIKLEVIIVDDCSVDKTPFVISKLIERHSENLRTIRNEANLGKSRTVAKGILATTGDYVVIQDADLEYDPHDIATMFAKLLTEKLDVVYGNRFGKDNKVIYIQNYLGNKLLSFISNIFTYPRLRTWIPDMEVCYKLIRGDVMRDIAKTLTATSNFGFEPEVTARLAKYRVDGQRLKLGIVPISYNPRTIAEGKKMKAFSDGFKALKEIINYNLLA